MGEYRPYSLKRDQRSSDTYYQTITTFAEHWLAAVREPLSRPAGHFQAFLYSRQETQAERLAPVRSFAEVAFELLALGVLLREHGEEALQMPAIPAWMLARLVSTQDRLPLPAVEKPVKAMRGLLHGLSQGGEPSGLAPDLLPFSNGTASLVGRLVDWLQAEGLTAQAERLAEWRAYLAQLDEQRAQAILARCLLLADEFAEISAATLGPFTPDAAAFSNQMTTCARWRYDAGLITRQPIEYHLGMLGTEILSQAYRQRFQAMPRKIVIVPDCLCAHSRRVSTHEAGKAETTLTCQAIRTDLGGKCQGCTPNCKVWQITRLGEKRGFEAYILPDDYRGIGLGSCSKLQGVGVVGVSCALTNWDAGWQINAAGVPAQGVLLDYAGCKSHWDEQGQTTDVNLSELLATLAVE